MRKNIILLGLSVLLTLTACDNPVQGLKAVPTPVSAGKGQVRVVLNNDAISAAVRTVMPIPDSTSVFAKFTYAFTPAAGGEAVEQTPVGDLFTLNTGAYTLTVKAFVDADDDAPAAQGESASFTVAVNTAATVTVTLIPEASDGTGVFTIAIVFPEGASVEALTLTPFPSGTEINLQTEAATTSTTLSKTLDEVDAGYYFLSAELKTTSGGDKYARRVEVVHIYKGLTTEISAEDWTFADTDFQTQAAKVIASLPAGTYDNDLSVTLSAVPETAAIVYSTDGNAPSTSYSEPLTIAPSTSSPVTLKAKATAVSWADSAVLETVYTFKAATPEVSVEAGNIAAGSTVTLSSATTGATIYYTTNGDAPTSSSTAYTGAITISADTNLKVIAIKANYTDSEVIEAAYTVMYPVSGTITVSSGTPTYTAATVTVTNAGSETIATTHPAASGSGAYTLTLPVGAHTLTVELSGHETKSIPLTVTNAALSDQDLTLSRIIAVTSNADSGAGTLRQALAGVAATGTTPDIIDVQVSGTITLTTGLTITTATNMDIRGNGATVLGSSILPISLTSRILTIGSSSIAPTVTIRRLRFDQGKADNYGGAIWNYGNTTLESCIFSNNSVTSNNSGGGAIRSEYHLTVTGCTFYNNSTEINSVGGGGAISSPQTGIVLTITGNLFYGNTTNYYPVIRINTESAFTSNGYNISDKASGTATGLSGWAFVTDKDTQVTAVTFDTTSFKPTSDKLATLQIVPEATAGYPETDFYGNTRAASASSGKIAAGAVWVTE